MRDKRFIAAHRGGPLALIDHRLLAGWALDCAEHLLPMFRRHSLDSRPQHAIEIGRSWVRGEIKTGVAQRAAVAAHAAARETTVTAAVAVARAAGHAVATAHFADHCLGPVIYGAKAVEAAGMPANEEWAWQLACLPDSVRALVMSGLEQRRAQRRLGLPNNHALQQTGRAKRSS
ncbi:putative immunity protein [Pirellulimonas nuda]|uniref:putative immunity protein n=1 Tax=Pirellulimonas nuda TaxID=2528009 RepID=UPI003704B0F3